VVFEVDDPGTPACAPRKGSRTAGGALSTEPGASRRGGGGGASGGGASGGGAGERLDLRLLLDGSVVEVFTGARARARAGSPAASGSPPGAPPLCYKRPRACRRCGRPLTPPSPFHTLILKT